MQINMKKMIRYVIAMIIGLSLTVYGVIDLTVAKYGPKPMSDAEIIERAKDLGMVDIKEEWLESQENESDD